MLQVTPKEMKTNEKKTFTVRAGYTLLATGLLSNTNMNEKCKM